MHIRKLTCTQCGRTFRKKQRLVLSSAHTKYTKQVSRDCMIKKGARETEEDSIAHRERDRSFRAQKRALETEEDSIARRERDRFSKARKKALETEEDSIVRRERDRSSKARKKALETEEDSAIRRERDRSSKARKKAQDSIARRERDRSSKARNKVLETEEDSIARRERDRSSKARNKVLETEEDSIARRELDRSSKARKKALETEKDSAIRRERDRSSKARKKILETEEDSIARRERDRIFRAQKRALETEEDSAIRREHDRSSKTRKRALETEKDLLKHKSSDRIRKALKKRTSTSVEAAIDSFITKTKQGPDYVCTCCHRIMYRQCVLCFNLSKYTKVSESELASVFSDTLLHMSPDGSYYICKTCHSALLRGKVPVQAKANNLGLSIVPPELACLNSLETRLVSLRVPFMSIVALPSGKQRCIHGPCINVPSKLDNICTTLPRLPSQSELIPLKFKRKLVYQGHYMYGYVSPQKILEALRWLKDNHPHYSDIQINLEWSEESRSSNFDLHAGFLNCAVEEPESPVVHSKKADVVANTHKPLSGLGNGCVSKHSTSPLPSVMTTALTNLEMCAAKNNFIIHDVPGDGNCLFHAVLYQLGTFSGTVDDLRQMVASYLDCHRDFYVNFVPQPVECSDPQNADNEPLDMEDLEIARISDSVLRAQKVWERFITRLKAGAWGNHVCIAAMANMFSATINVFKATDQTCFTESVAPMEGESTLEVNIGLTLQNHYVGLERVHPVISPSNCVLEGIHEPNPQPCVPPSNREVSSNPVSASSKADVIPSHVDTSSIVDIRSTESDKITVDTSDSEPANVSEIAIDDETFEKGDEIVKQITGGPTATMMTIEDPEAFSEVVCVAPAEGQKPLFIMTDPPFESMSNPVKFPYGTGCFSSDRPQKLTYRKYFNQRLLDVDGRFAYDVDYLFTAQYIVESKQILDDCNHFIWRQKPGRDFTASQARDHSVLSQCIRKDKAYRFMKNIRGSPPYYQKTFYELLAMIRQLGTPTWFFTVSSADMKWPDIIQTIAKQFGTEYTEEQVIALSFEEKSNWIRRNPVTAARHFQYRLNLFFSEFLKGSAKPLGEIEDLWYQNRVSVSWFTTCTLCSLDQRCP